MASLSRLPAAIPGPSYAHIARASFGSLGVFSDTMVKATPLMLVGLACSLAFRMKLWNIGAEGQFFMGAFGASAVVLIPLLPRDCTALVVHHRYDAWPGCCAGRSGASSPAF